jgi:hypothetical protein
MCAIVKDWRCRARVALTRTPWLAHVARMECVWQRQSFSRTLTLEFGKSSRISTPTVHVHGSMWLCFSVQSNHARLGVHPQVRPADRCVLACRRCEPRSLVAGIHLHVMLLAESSYPYVCCAQCSVKISCSVLSWRRRLDFPIARNCFPSELPFVCGRFVYRHRVLLFHHDSLLFAPLKLCSLLPCALCPCRLLACLSLSSLALRMTALASATTMLRMLR